MAKPSEIIGLGPDTRLAKAAEKAVAARLADVRAHEARLAARQTPDAVHDVRVAVRRLRATLRVFDRAGRLTEARAEVSRLARALGAVRDLDLLLQWLDETLGDPALAPDEQAGTAALRARKHEQRETRVAELLAALGRWRDEAAPAIEAIAPIAGSGGRLGGDRLRRRLRRRIRQAQRTLAAALIELDPRSSHELRVQVKKLRDEAGPLEDAFPGAVAAIDDAFSPLQDALGELHDLDVRVELAQRFAVDAAVDERLGALALLRRAVRARTEKAAEVRRILEKLDREGTARALRQRLRRA